MAVPNFFVIGAQKCGTDALYHALKKHPDIYMSPEKEPFYFIADDGSVDFKIPTFGYGNRLVLDRDRYLNLFDAVDGEKAIGEASAIYLSSYYPEKTAARIRSFNPDARIIALLRQPVDRAYSAFNFYHARDLEPLSDFEAALSVERNRIDNNEFPDIRHRSNGYYFANLKPYFDAFPREQIRVFLFEDWNQEPRAVLREIFRFLGVDERFTVEVGRENVTRRYRSKVLRRVYQRLSRYLIDPGAGGATWMSRVPLALIGRLRKWNEVPPRPLAPAIRRALTEEYRHDIKALQTLIDRDLGHWLA